MKNYKDYEMVYLGASDISCLSFRSCGEIKNLDFGSDGVYWAYLVDKHCKIPDHYDLKIHFRPDEYGKRWLWVYDDRTRTFMTEFANEIKIYRAGDFGIIIQLLNYDTEI